MKNRLLPYYFLCVGIYVVLSLIEFVMMNFLIQIFTTNAIVSVTAALPMLLFVNPVLTWFTAETLMKK